MMVFITMAIPSITNDLLLDTLAKRAASQSGGAIHAFGLWGSSAPVVAAHIASTSIRPIVYITAHLEEADNARDDLELFFGRSCEIFPAWESIPGEGAASGEIEAERLLLCNRLAAKNSGENQIFSRSGNQSTVEKDQDHFIPVIVTPVQALMQPVPPQQTLRENTISLKVGAAQNHPSYTPESLLAWAIDRGFERLDMVESPGDIAMRGDIVDLFAPGEVHPYRIEFMNDEIESIRYFDVSSQRSIEQLPSISITVMAKTSKGIDGEVTDFFAYLPPETLILLDGPDVIQEMGETLQKRLGDSRQLFKVSDVLQQCNQFTQIYLSRFGSAATTDEDTFDFSVGSLERFEGNATEVITTLGKIAVDRETTIHVICDNEGERQRFNEIVSEHIPDASNSIISEIGVLHHGFEWTRTKTIVVPHHELFHRQRQRRRLRKIHASRSLESWTDLKPGDYVVHVVHGIALYRGLHKIRKDAGTLDRETGHQEEFLTLEFADRAVIHVPCSHIDLVQKYIGAAGHKVRLSTLGSKRWGKTKELVADAVSELANTLLRIQAMRNEASGTAYPKDTSWQREFEAAFIYEETEDQLRVAQEIRDDLIRSQPMDRLICGDVGYGKTELAMRAAFKVVEYGRQVAVLVPTTVLAEQHYETFRSRMADYPFSVGCLSRFRSGAEQTKIINMVKKGQIDIIIGTHRLLSKDVAFANLGLVVIDEEQRFGVEHKEKLKTVRETVDVLTLTATPIPRTLHLSLLGVRDISSLQTPPIDRRAIATQVRNFDKSLIREAILREMNRDGQIYFVHNFVQSIASMTDTIRQIVPEARVVFAHGQMKGGELEDVMHRFVRREADVLVSTTIIESGIDIPTVNTIFINRAERFGLADLHQLRGRVGRSDHRAYCYLLLSPGQTPSSKAAKRLKTIEEFSELGAGFRIAMRDLEIRGAGNILGKQQTGHIAAVGYEMYCRLLDQTISRMKNEPDPSAPLVQLDLEVAAHIPPHYIQSERSRIEIYRRIVNCRTSTDLSTLERDLVDAFGSFPKQVQRLLELAEIRVLARRFGIVSISLRKPDIVFAIEHLSRAEPVFIDAPGSVRMPDPQTIHLRLTESYLEPKTLIPILRNMLNKACKRLKVVS